MAQPRRFALALLTLTGAMAMFRGDPALAQGGAWVKKTPMQPPRRLLAAAADDGKIYTFGGCGSPCFEPPIHTSTDEETRVQVYDPDRDTWEERQRMSAILFGAAAATVKHKIYTFGGYVTPTLTQEYDPAPANDSWRKRSPMPTPRHGLAAVAFKDEVYVLGGSDGTGPSNALEIYNPMKDTWTRGAPMPTARVFLAAAELEGKIYAIGGSPDCCGKSQTNAVEIYDPVRDSWTTGTPLRVAEQTSAAAALNGKIYVFGGFIPGSGVQNKTFEYDPTTRSWSTNAEMRTPRDQAPAVAVGDFIYVIGGAVDCHCRALGDNERFTPTPLTCMKTGPTSVDAGATVTYTIKVTNNGETAATGITLNDPTPARVMFFSADPPCDKRFPCSLDPIDSDESQSVKVTFQVPAGCSAPKSIKNVAEVEVERKVVTSCDSTTSVIRPPVELTCEKRQTQGPNPAKPGDEVAYEIGVSNIGCVAAKGVTLSDPTPAGLEYLSGPCVKSPCKLGTIGPDGSHSPREVKFRVLSGMVGGCRETVINTATVKASNAPESICSIETGLIFDLAVDVSFPGDVVSPPLPLSGGEERDVSVLVSNTGPPTARNVSLKVKITGADAVTVVPPACVPVQNDPGSFICTGQEIKCGAAVKFDFRVRAPACPACSTLGPITATAMVTAPPDADPSNNQDSAATQVTCPLKEDLAIDKEDAPDPVGPGDVLQYTITVTNKGCNTTATVTEMFPPELTSIRWCRDAGFPCTPNLPEPLQETISLLAGGSATYRATYRASGIAPAMMCTGTLTNIAKVVGPPGFIDIHPEDNSATEETTIAGTGVRAFCKGISGAFIEGGMITKTFVLLNCGPAVQMDNPGDEFKDTLPASLTLTGAGASSGIATTAGNMAMWNGSIPVGGMVTITATATINAGTAGTTICNQAMINFDADGDGTNESSGLSDDPGLPGAADPCCFRVLFDFEIPALSAAGLAALALLLASFALLRLRRRTP